MAEESKESETAGCMALVVLVVILGTAVWLAVDWMFGDDDVDYRAEIMESVVEPCLYRSIERGIDDVKDLKKVMSNEEIMEFIRITGHASLDEMVDKITPLVVGREPSERKVVYRAHRRICFEGVELLLK